jgi:methionyl-tRNA synthetase
VRTLAILLEPYTPFSAEKLWQQLNLDSNLLQQKWDAASQVTIRSGHKIRQPSALFEKIQDKDIEKEKQRLNKVTGSK